MISAACHKNPLVPSVSGVRLLYIGLYRQLRQFCDTCTEVTNYVIALCETVQKPRTTEIEF